MRLLPYLLVLFSLPLGAQTYGDWTVDMEDNNSLRVGQIGEVEVTVDFQGFEDDYGGLSMAFKTDPTKLVLVDVQMGPDLAAINGGNGPAYFSAVGGIVCNGGENVGVGTIVDFSGANGFGADGVFLLVRYEAIATGSADITANISSSEWVCGTPFVETIVADYTSGEFGPITGSSDFVSDVSIASNQQQDFVRGDVNHDGSLDISDPVKCLLILFEGDTNGCDDAADVNDDGAVNIVDPVYLLAYLYNSGSAPPAPFSSCGSDGTTDSLDCFVPGNGC